MDKADIIGGIIVVIVIGALIIFGAVSIKEYNEGKLDCAAKNGTTEVLYQDNGCYVKK